MIGVSSILLLLIVAAYFAWPKSNNGITQEDNVFFGPTNNRVYGDHIFIPGNSLKSS